MTTAKKKLDDDVQPTDQAPEEAPVVEPPEEVRVFAAAVRSHANARNQNFEPKKDVKLRYSHNGLLRVHPHNRFTHIATHEELPEMSDQDLHDAVMAASVR